MTFSKFSADEVERRRKLSVAAMKERDRLDFDARYQEVCDREYWTFGKCCAGCDYWSSGGGYLGRCAANGILSGEGVLRSMGITFSSLMPEPGFPYTRSHHVCGLFSDEFDWSSLPDEYLNRIGARRDGKLRLKPSHMIARTTKEPTE